MLSAQLVATGCPWVTQQCLANQILIYMILIAKIVPPQKSYQPIVNLSKTSDKRLDVISTTDLEMVT